MKTLYEKTNFIHPCFIKVRFFKGLVTTSFDYSHFSSIIRHIAHGYLAFTLSKKGLKEKKLSEEKSRIENLNALNKKLK